MMARLRPPKRLDRLGSAVAAADFLGAVAKHARWQVLIETVSDVDRRLIGVAVMRRQGCDCRR